MKAFTDIETVPQQPEDEAKEAIAKEIKAPAKMTVQATIDDWHNGGGKYAGVKEKAIEEVYRKTSFDGSKGEIISMAWAFDEAPVESISRNLGESEGDMIKQFFGAAVSANAPSASPFFIGHFIAGFDLKFIFHRCVVLGIKPPFDLPFNGRHNQNFYCTQSAWAGFRDHISQDALCKALGIEGKPSDIDGSKVWDFVKAGKIKEVEAYNVDDVEKNRMIYNRLNFITG